MKTCKKCKLEKEESDFAYHDKPKGTRRGICKECTKEVSHNYYSNHKEQAYLQSLAWHRSEKGKKQLRKRHLRKTYGITVEQYNVMFDEQDGCCAICGKHQAELSKPLCIDHNHETKEIRSLLCNDCNSALGFAHENIEVLENMIKYISRYFSPNLQGRR